MSLFHTAAGAADRGEPDGTLTTTLPPLPPLAIACFSISWAVSTGGPATVLL